MSRSKPNEGARNPCRIWLEWAGGDDGGFLRYYDKEKGENVSVALPVPFLLLDELSTVRGWHDPSESGIYANEVRDTRQDTLTVKAFKGGELASGLYANIRDRVKASGGRFQSSTYVAVRIGTDPLTLANIAFKGAALRAWMDFKSSPKVRGELYKKAIVLFGYDDAKKGATDYRVPKFSLKDVSEDTNAEALALDEELQAYLSSYLSRTRDEQTTAPAISDEPPANANRDAADERMARDEGDRQASRDFYDDDIPF